LGGSAGVVSISGEGNASLVAQDVLHVFDGSLQVHTLDSSTSFEGVLEVDSEVRSLSLDSWA